MSVLGRVLALLAGAACALVVSGAPAQAHTDLDYSIPADGASLGKTPGVVQLVFTEPVDAELSTVVVRGPKGELLADGPARQAASGLMQPVTQPAEGGRIVVSWRTVSLDGHPVTGEFGFDVARGNPKAAAQAKREQSGQTRPEQSPQTQGAAAPGSDDSGTSATGLVLGAAAVLALILVGALMARRRRGRPSRPGSPSATPTP